MINYLLISLFEFIFPCCHVCGMRVAKVDFRVVMSASEELGLKRVQHRHLERTMAEYKQKGAVTEPLLNRIL